MSAGWSSAATASRVPGRDRRWGEGREDTGQYARPGRALLVFARKQPRGGDPVAVEKKMTFQVQLKINGQLGELSEQHGSRTEIAGMQQELRHRGCVYVRYRAVETIHPRL